MTDILLETRNAEIAILTMNRPKARNSLSLEMMAVLNQAILRLGGDASVKAIILKGEGPAFCAGHDLKEISAARNGDDQGRRQHLGGRDLDPE